MEIIDLSLSQQQLYFNCLEDWSAEIREAGSHKETWYKRMKDKGLQVKLARDEQGTVGGMIQYLPIEQTGALGKDLYFIYCIWVHGHKQGRGNFQKQGMGKALLKAAEADVKQMGAGGLVAWGVRLPFFMRASWFKKQGYKMVDKMGIAALLWKPFNSNAEPPRWIRRKKQPAATAGKVTVSAFINGWCPAQNMVFERAKRASLEFGDAVQFKEYYTADRDLFLEWGISDALYVDKRQINSGPPPSYQKIRKIIDRQVKKTRG